MRFKINSSRGSMLVSLLITLPFLLLIAASYMNLSTQSYKLGKIDQLRTSAQLAADAGADYAIKQLNIDPDWTNTTSPVELHNDDKIRATFVVSTQDIDDTHKTITATGYTYSPVTHTEPDSSVTIKVDLRSVTTGNFSLVTGVGGLIMRNSAKILGGNVYVNGEIDMANSVQIGLSTNPIEVNVANQSCPQPPDASYPRLCNTNEGSEPISIKQQAHIYGTVRANNQTDGSGMSNNGLVASSGVAALPLPAHDRTAQKAAVTNTITGTAASCNNQETRTWAANTKIVGDVSVGNSCVVTVMGDIWVTGEFWIKNSGRVYVSNSVGTNRPSIMVDGQEGAKFTNSARLISNNSGTGFEVVSYWSRASCSPDCADVTGVDLYNTRNDITVAFDNHAEAPQTILYARWGQLLLNNSGEIGALVGQTVNLRNSGAVTFGTSVDGAGSTFWVIDGYRRSF